jgi:hypothetical protein
MHASKDSMWRVEEKIFWVCMASERGLSQQGTDQTGGWAHTHTVRVGPRSSSNPYLGLLDVLERRRRHVSWQKLMSICNASSLMVRATGSTTQWKWTGVTNFIFLNFYYTTTCMPSWSHAYITLICRRCLNHAWQRETPTYFCNNRYCHHQLVVKCAATTVIKCQPSLYDIHCRPCSLNDFYGWLFYFKIKTLYYSW